MFLKSTNNTIESYPYNTREDYPLTAFPPGADYPTFNIYWVHPTPQSPPPDHTATEGQPVYNNELNRWEQTWEYQEVVPPVVPDWDSFNAYMLSDPTFKSYRDIVRSLDGDLTSALFTAYNRVDKEGVSAFTLVWGQWCSVSGITAEDRETIAGVAEGFNLPADTALQPGDIGVTVQGYSANTVIDANYVATENSYTTTEKTKLAGIADGAEVNVNADWNAVDGDALILNKPTLGTAAATDSTDYATAAQGTLADTALQPSALNNTALTGIPTAPTAPEGTDTTQIATTAFVLANSSNASLNFSVNTVTYNDGGTSTIDANSGGNVAFSLTSNGSSTTIAMANIPTTGTRYAFELHLTWTSGAITFPASWSRGENPPNTTGNYLITGITIDGGTSFTLTVVYQ